VFIYNQVPVCGGDDFISGEHARDLIADNFEFKAKLHAFSEHLNKLAWQLKHCLINGSSLSQRNFDDVLTFCSKITTNFSCFQELVLNVNLWRWIRLQAVTKHLFHCFITLQKASNGFELSANATMFMPGMSMISPNNMSLATKKYMKKYGLIPVKDGEYESGGDGSTGSEEEEIVDGRGAGG